MTIIRQQHLAYSGFLLVLLFIFGTNLTPALGANPNQGGGSLVPGSFSGTLSAFNDLQLTIIGSNNPLDRSFGYLRIFDSAGNRWVACTQEISPTVYPNGSSTVRLGDMFGEITYMPPGEYTLMAGGRLTGVGCFSASEVTLTQARNGSWSDQTMDIPITITETAPQISFFSPQPNTLVHSFDYWGIDGYSFPATSTEWTLKINYYPGSSTNQTFSDQASVTSNGATPFLQVPKTQDLTFSFEWHAWAELYDQSSALIASSSLIYFQSSASSTLIGPTMPSSTEIVDCAGNQICNFFVWGFIPKKSDFLIFSNLQSFYGNKPPFGYFVSLSSAINNLSSTATSSIMSSSTYSAVSDVFNPLRSGLSWVIWLIWGIGTLTRVAHFDFHA